jgi:hypothetical protein
MSNSKNRPPGEPVSTAQKPAPKPAATSAVPRKGFDPASLQGGKHPGGKPLRGGKMMQSFNSRGRG